MNFPVLATLGIVTTILVFVIVVATQAWFRYQFQREYQHKVVDRPNLFLDGIRTEQEKALREGPVPIDQAMQQVIAQYQQSSPAGGSGQETAE